MNPATAIETIANSLRDEPGIRALFLSGSYGNGLEDEYSDVDFVLVASDGATDEIAELWRKACTACGEIILWWDRQVRPLLINAITKDWLRIDVIILKPDQLGGQAQDALKTVFDHDGLYDGLVKHAEKAAPNAAHAKYQFEEFIRILGLLPLAIGRKEYINGVLGIFNLRNLLVDLMIAETDAPHRGGVLHLNRLISDEQKQVLLSLPPPVPERDAMIAANLAYAEAYLPRARAMAKQWGVEWPQRLETAMWQRLYETLGIERPYTLD